MGIFLAYMHRWLISRLRFDIFWKAGRDTVKAVWLFYPFMEPYSPCKLNSDPLWLVGWIRV